MNIPASRTAVELLAEKAGLQGCDLIKVSDPGSSQSRVYIFSTPQGELRAVKMRKHGDDHRVSLEDEVNNQRFIKEYFPDNTAEIYWAGTYSDYDAIIYECIGVGTLHHEIALGNMAQSETRGIWSEVIEAVTSTWQSTRTQIEPKTSYARDYTSRFNRIYAGLQRFKPVGLDEQIGDYFKLPVEVNGRLYPSLEETFEHLKRYDEPEYTVICHGDPQPSNVIVNSNTRQWQFIDWEWSAAGHDWRMMAAHLYGWWISRTVQFKKSPEIILSDSLVKIGYEIADSEVNDAFKEQTLTLLNRKMGLLDNDRDRTMFNHFLTLLLLGEIRFTPYWGREKHVPYLIGAAIEAMYGSEGRSEK